MYDIDVQYSVTKPETDQHPRGTLSSSRKGPVLLGNISKVVIQIFGLQVQLEQLGRHEESENSNEPDDMSMAELP